MLSTSKGFNLLDLNTLKLLYNLPPFYFLHFLSGPGQICRKVSLLLRDIYKKNHL